MRDQLSLSYASLRFGGCSPSRAAQFLGLQGPGTPADIERAFLSGVRERGGPKSGLPRFAKDEPHVQAVRSERGIFPVMPGVR